jgi:predicted transcriptional regulator
MKYFNEDDIALYDQRKADLAAGKDAVLLAEISAMLLKGDSRLKAIRRWRSMKQVNLSAKSGIGQGYVSDLESRRRTGSPQTLAALAKVLMCRWRGWPDAALNSGLVFF